MGLNFRDPSTMIMEGIIDLHSVIMYYLIIILVLVFWMIFDIINYYGFGVLFKSMLGLGRVLEVRKEVMVTKNVVHGKLIEVIWTILPSLVLVMISVPSFSLLYSIDELIEPVLTLKAIGHQWYWSYEYSDFEDGDICYDSYMVLEEDLELGDFRLLEVDRKVWLPIHTHIRVLITSLDVLHCWAVPSMGIKLDAVPGRLNQCSIYLKRQGLFYGQCSELCGVQHGFMPIVVKGVSIDLFNEWVDFNINNG